MHGQDANGVRWGMPVHLPTLHIRVTRERAIPIVILVGEVDLMDIGRLDDCLAALSGTVIIDLNSVTFLGSTGLRTFVMTHKRLHSDGGKLLLRSPKDHVRRVLEITGLDFMLLGTANTDGRPAA
jgi:anti-anti-sigma factor